MIDLTQIVIALIGVLATLITAYVIPWIKKHTTVKQQESISFWLDIAVNAAEQIYSSGQGEQKWNYVVDYLSKNGIKIDETAIEAYVQKNFGKEK